MVDTPDLGSGAFGVRVRVSPSAPSLCEVHPPHIAPKSQLMLAFFMSELCIYNNLSALVDSLVYLDYGILFNPT